VFANEIGQPLKQRRIHEEFKKLLAAAELPTSHRPYDLRHSMATYLSAAGVPRAWSWSHGHSTMAMTQRYSHVLGPMVTAAADRLEALRLRASGRS
jgi:site-specific recombinase XerD